MPAPRIPILDGIAALAPRYDAWLADVWGVLHNGERVFAPAAEACRRFREGGGTAVLISNSPRPAEAVIGQLDQVGVPRAAYDSLVTSGDVSRALIRARRAMPMFHLGPERDLALFAGLDIALTPPGEAALVVCSGLFDDSTETPDDYAKLLAELKARDLPMICANPDQMVERGDTLIYCAGALALRYEALGGEVLYSGKPHAPIYELAFRRLAEHLGRPADRARVLAIGDGLETDIKGAATAGLDCVYVASPVHMQGAGGGLDEGRLEALFRDARSRPVAALAALKW